MCTCTQARFEDGVKEKEIGHLKDERVVKEKDKNCPSSTLIHYLSGSIKTLNTSFSNLKRQSNQYICKPNQLVSTCRLQASIWTPFYDSQNEFVLGGPFVKPTTTYRADRSMTPTQILYEKGCHARVGPNTPLMQDCVQDACLPVQIISTLLGTSIWFTLFAHDFCGARVNQSFRWFARIQE